VPAGTKNDIAVLNGISKNTMTFIEASANNPNVIDANKIEWLCKDVNAKQMVHESGICIIDAKIHNRLRIDNVTINFPLQFTRCTFDDTIFCTCSHIASLIISKSNLKALYLNNSTISNNLILSNSIFYGNLIFPNANINGNCKIDSSVFLDSSTTSINCYCSNILGSLFLTNSIIANEFDFYGAHIFKDIDLSNSFFKNKSHSIIGCNALIDQSMLLIHTNAYGELNIVNSTINNSIEIDSAHFVNKNGITLNAGGIKVTRGINIRKITNIGTFSLTGSTINSDIVFLSSVFKVLRPYDIVIQAEGINLNGNLYLTKDNTIYGRISLNNSQISKCLFLECDTLSNIYLDLQNSKANVYHDTSTFRLRLNGLNLNGFCYSSIDNKASLKDLLEWVKLSSLHNYSTQPYNQLSEYLFKIGKEEEAISVLIQKKKDLLKYTKQPFANELGLKIFGFVGYGYKPENILYVSFFIILFGYWLFRFAYNNGLMIVSKEIPYVKGKLGDKSSLNKSIKFFALMYSFELFIPISNYSRSRVNKTFSVTEGSKHFTRSSKTL
jgi:DNA-binding XRE family transcriptional regulator